MSDAFEQESDDLALKDFVAFVLRAPNASVVVACAAEMERMRITAGVTTEELLAGLREQRQAYNIDSRPVP